MFSRGITALLLLGSFLLAGCGGGSSSSGSGGNATSGTFRGVFNTTIKVRQEIISQRATPIVVVASANLVEVQIPTLNVRARALRNGNNFEVSQVFRERLGIYSCVGPWTINGNVGTSRVNGRLIIDYTCSAAGRATERVVTNSAWQAN